MKLVFHIHGHQLLIKLKLMIWRKVPKTKGKDKEKTTRVFQMNDFVERKKSKRKKNKNKNNGQLREKTEK